MSITVDNGAMLNAYPDSIGGTLGDVVSFLKEEKMALLVEYLLLNTILIEVLTLL